MTGTYKHKYPRATEGQPVRQIQEDNVHNTPGIKISVGSPARPALDGSATLHDIQLRVPPSPAAKANADSLIWEACYRLTIHGKHVHVDCRTETITVRARRENSPR